MKTIPGTINKVSVALGISCNDYINRFYNSGYEYLTAQRSDSLNRLGGKVSAKKRADLQRFTNMFLFSPVFWFWWRSETEKADRAFLRSGSCSVAIYDNLQKCRLLVPPENILNEIIDNQPKTKQYETERF